MKYLMLFVFLFMASIAFAGPSPAIDAATSWLLSPSGWVTVLAGLAAEIIMRLSPTAKPAGFLHMISGVCNTVVAWLTQLAGLVAALAKFSDSILPQNTSS